MQERGNSKARSFYEKCVPTFIYRPQQNDCMWVPAYVCACVCVCLSSTPLLWGRSRRLERNVLPVKIMFLFLFLFSEFWKISGSERSTKEENSQVKATTSHFIAQVITLYYWIILNIISFFHMQSSLIALYLFLTLFSNPDQLEVTLWKKGKDNKQFLKRRFLLSRTDFTLRYFIKGDVSCVSYVLLLTLWFHVLILEPALPSNQVQGSQSCDLHEGPECSVPAWEDPPRSRPAALLPARWTDKESVCLSWGWIRESAGPLNFALLGVKCAADPAASDICNVLNFRLSFSSSAKLCLRECNTKSLICCLPGNCIPVQCHQGNTAGVPAEETSHSSRRWRETAFFFSSDAAMLLVRVCLSVFL